MALLLKSDPVAWRYSEKKLLYPATLLKKDSDRVGFFVKLAKF